MVIIQMGIPPAHPWSLIVSRKGQAPVVEACRAVTSPFPSRIWFVVAPNLSYLNAPKKHDLRKVSSMSIMSIMVLGQGQYGKGVLMM